MARYRSKGINWFELAGSLAGLALVLWMISLQLGQIIFGLGIIAVCVLALVVVYRWTERTQPPASGAGFVLRANAPVSQKPAMCRFQSTAELIAQMRSIDWYQFEKLVALLYRKLGYTVDRRGGANPDGGIDLVIQKDGQRSAVQCKQWKTWNVGVKAVREFLGALTDARMQKGVFITLSGYTREARQLAEKHGTRNPRRLGYPRPQAPEHASNSGILN